MARPYTKRNLSYWQALSSPIPAPAQQTAIAKTPDLKLENLTLVEGAADSYTGRSGGTKGAPDCKYPLIDALPLPFEDRKGIMCASRAMELCEKLFFNFAPYRNVIRALVEFTATKIHFQCRKNKAVVESCEQWSEYVNLDSLQEQILRDFFCKGNAFCYEFRGKLAKNDVEKLETALGAAGKGDVPIRYEVLNPRDIGVRSAMFVDRSYVKIFNDYELARLRIAKSDTQEWKVLQSMPPEVQKEIKNSRGLSHIVMDLDKSRISFMFYEKQDYQAYGIPFGWAVLDDVELKLTLKKMDKTLAKTMENVILLISHGAPPDAGGINQQNHQALQDLFKVQAVSRVIIADYTTKAQFIIPDLKEVLGPAKYQQVNEDIREALSAFLFGDSRFADAVMKARIFIEHCQSVVEKLDRDFLMPKVKDFCDSIGARHYPKIVREKVDLEDPAVRDKVTTRLAELGILTAPDTLRVMENGIYPDEDTNKEHQKAHKKDREDGLYLPLIGGSTSADMAEAGRPEGTTGIKKDSVRVGITGHLTPKDLTKIVSATVKLQTVAMELIKDDTDVENKLDYAAFLVKEVVKNAPLEKWEETLKGCVASCVPPAITETTREIQGVSEELQVDEYGAALLVHARHLPKE